MGGMNISHDARAARDYAGQRIGAEPLYTPAEVAALFRVDPKTVTRWAIRGRIPSFRTLGGHRRFRQSDVHALLAGTGTAPPDEDD